MGKPRSVPSLRRVPLASPTGHRSLSIPSSSWASTNPCTLSARRGLPLLLPLVEPRVVSGVIPRHQEPLQPLVLHYGVHPKLGNVSAGRRGRGDGGRHLPEPRRACGDGAAAGAGASRGVGPPRSETPWCRKHAPLARGPRKCHGLLVVCALSFFRSPQICPGGPNDVGQPGRRCPGGSQVRPGGKGDVSEKGAYV